MSGNIPWSDQELMQLKRLCMAGLTPTEIHEQHMPGRRLRAIKYKICEGRKSEPKAYPKHRKAHMLTRAERQQMMLDLYAKYVPRPERAIS